MARSARWPLLIVSGSALVASCAVGASGPALAPSEPPPAASPPITPSVSAPVLSAVVSATPATSARPSPRPHFAPGTIRCSDKVCKAGKEVCCDFGGESSCAERKPLGTGNMLEQKLEAQLKSCQDSSKSKYSFSGLAYCDDSADCPANQVCCTNWGPGSGSSHTLCVPAARDKSNVCELSESCVDGQACATVNTHCDSGQCVLNNPRVRCGGVVCEGASPVCCTLDPDKPPRCLAADQCKAPPDTGPFPMANECSGPSSCPKGMLCQRNMMHTYCSGMMDGANARLVCETEKDCPPDTCTIWGSKGKPKCIFDTDFSYCTCP